MNQKTALTGGDYHWTADFGVFHDISDDSYKRGFADGFTEGENTGYAAGEKTGYDAGHTAGQKAEYDRFWDMFQKNGNRRHYSFAFGSGWTAELFKPKYPIRPVLARYLIYTYASGNIADFIDIPDFAQFCRTNNVVLDFSECTNAEYALYSLKTKRLGVLDFSKCTNLNSLFWADGGPETVDQLIASEITGFSTSTFQHATNLINITMGGVVGKSIFFDACPKLTNESAQSVIDHLADLTGKTAQTLTFHADVGARLTDAQKATVTAKNWTLVY